MSMPRTTTVERHRHGRCILITRTWRNCCASTADKNKLLRHHDMNNTCSFFSRLSHLLILRRAAVILVILAWNSLAFCGEIHDAAESGNLEKVKALIKENPSSASSKEDTWGKTPLHYAAMRGHKDVVELLLANGADVNAEDNFGETPLHCAADGNKDLVALLL